MSETNVALAELITTDGMDFSHRGTPLTPSAPEHYTNKKYVDTTLAGSTGRPAAVVPITCDGVETSYTVTHNLGTTNIASLQIFDTTGGTKNPIGVSWEPTTNDTITLKPDIVLPSTMTLLVVVTA